MVMNRIKLFEEFINEKNGKTAIYEPTGETVDIEYLDDDKMKIIFDNGETEIVSSKEPPEELKFENHINEKSDDLEVEHGYTEGEVLRHKHQEIEIKLLKPTKKGWQVEQTDYLSPSGAKKRKPKPKKANYSKRELDDLFERIEK